MVDEESPPPKDLEGHLLRDIVRIEIAFFSYEMNVKEVCGALDHETMNPSR